MTAPLTRTTHRTVTFARPFVLSGLEGAQPAGRYTVETDDELLQALSFPAYRRLETRIRLPGGGGNGGGGAGFEQVARIDPVDLDDALARDATGERGDTAAAAAAVGDRAPIPTPSITAPTSPGSERAPAMTTNLFTISLTVLGVFLLLGGIARFITP